MLKDILDSYRIGVRNEIDMAGAGVRRARKKKGTFFFPDLSPSLL
jgi:hypothetical protein